MFTGRFDINRSLRMSAVGTPTESPVSAKSRIPGLWIQDLESAPRPDDVDDGSATGEALPVRELSSPTLEKPSTPGDIEESVGRKSVDSIITQSSTGLRTSIVLDSSTSNLNAFRI